MPQRLMDTNTSNKKQYERNLNLSKTMEPSGVPLFGGYLLRGSPEQKHSQVQQLAWKTYPPCLASFKVLTMPENNTKCQPQWIVLRDGSLQCGQLGGSQTSRLLRIHPKLKRSMSGPKQKRLFYFPPLTRLDWPKKSNQTCCSPLKWSRVQTQEKNTVQLWCFPTSPVSSRLQRFLLDNLAPNGDTYLARKLPSVPFRFRAEN